LIVCHWQKQIPALLISILISEQSVLNGPCGSAEIASG